MGKPITNIAVVGGGTAGWIVAAYLNHRLQWGLTGRPDVRVSLIESPRIPTIGVGEATVPTLKATLRILEISEAEFLLRTEGSFKLGIRFDDWQRRADGTPYSYCHPFTGGSAVRGRNPGYSFLEYGLPGQEAAHGSDFLDTVSHTRAALDQRKGPRSLDGADFTGPLHYAYHIDAGLLAEFLREICVARGVEHVRDEVHGITRDERGFITSLRLAERGDRPVELVIDCTGFQGLLINKMMEEPFVPLSDYLLNDRAIPIQVRRGDRADILPATVATAMDSGWSWRIPLHTRDGTGYVYSSAFASDEEALDGLTRLIGAEDWLVDPRVIHMRVGHSRRSWVNNCVAIGPSSGFLEPLESTAIMSIELAVRWLLQNFPTLDFEPPLQRQYNRNLQRFYDEVRDFLALHFSLSNREDTPYWRAVRNDAKLSDGLRENLALWKHALPSSDDARTSGIFGHWSVQCVLFGKGYYDDAAPTRTDIVPIEAWRWYWADFRARKRATIGALGDHFELLEAIRARAVAGSSLDRRPKGRDFQADEEAILEATRVLLDTEMGRRSMRAERLRRAG